MSRNDTLPDDAAKAEVVPPPWHLKGRGFMFLYHFPEHWAGKANFMPEESHGPFAGGLGALMLVDYQSSDAGPYRELLFIPGKFLWQGDKRHAISRIWVSTQSSVVSGRANWGIPKQLAEFDVSSTGQRRERWEVKLGGKPFFAASLHYGRIPLPMHTALVPFPLRQWLGGQGFITRFSGYGVSRLAQFEQLDIDSSHFPDIGRRRPILGLEIEPFFITFPLPELAGEANRQRSFSSRDGTVLRTAP